MRFQIFFAAPRPPAHNYLGWVPSTELGSGIIDYMAKYAPQTPAVTTADSAAGVIKVLESLNIEETGTFFNYDGTKLLW